MLIKHGASDEAPHKKYINVFIDDRYPKLKLGAYRFRLSLNPQWSDQDMEYHAWIERNDDYSSRFTAKCSKPDFTINSIGNARLPIVVGAFNSHDNASPIADFSSSGPSRNQNATNKPDICAPGINIFAARALHSGLDDGISKPGTSMAAPHVTGLIALMLQAAAGKNPPEQLTIQKIQRILTETADRNPPQIGANGHDARYGSGRVNGAQALIKLLSS
jgi:subtilisin family serine protease